MFSCDLLLFQPMCFYYPCYSQSQTIKSSLALYTAPKINIQTKNTSPEKQFSNNNQRWNNNIKTSISHTTSKPTTNHDHNYSLSTLLLVRKGAVVMDPLYTTHSQRGSMKGCTCPTIGGPRKNYTRLLCGEATCWK